MFLISVLGISVQESEEKEHKFCNYCGAVIKIKHELYFCPLCRQKLEE